MARPSKRNRDERRFGRPERLADKIISNGLDPREPPWVEGDALAGESWKQCKDRVIQSISRSQVIAIQNVCEYCHSYYAGKYIDYHDDIPNYMPPFSPMFVEYANEKDGRQGFLFQCFGGRGFPDIPFKLSPELSETKWSHIVLAEHFFSFPDSKYAHGPHATYMIGIDERGSLVGSVNGNVAYSGNMPEPIFKMYVDLSRPAFFPACLALSFMHCKNVALETIEPDAALNRDRKKAGLKPFVRYHTINIEPMKRVLRTEGQVETVGLKKALHIARGHFATYTPEKPLFGTFSGVVWKPAHTRGSLKQGVVASDYKVHPPAAPTPTTTF